MVVDVEENMTYSKNKVVEKTTESEAVRHPTLLLGVGLLLGRSISSTAETRESP